MIESAACMPVCIVCKCTLDMSIIEIQEANTSSGSPAHYTSESSDDGPSSNHSDMSLIASTRQDSHSTQAPADFMVLGRPTGLPVPQHEVLGAWRKAHETAGLAFPVLRLRADGRAKYPL